MHAERVGHVGDLACRVGGLLEDSGGCGSRRGGCGVACFAQGAGEDAHKAVGIGMVVDEAALVRGPDEDELLLRR